MMRSVFLVAVAVVGFGTASTKEAAAVVYCPYVAYPAGCVVRPAALPHFQRFQSARRADAISAATVPDHIFGLFV